MKRYTKELIKEIKHTDGTIYNLYSLPVGYEVEIIDLNKDIKTEYIHIESMQDIVDLLNENLRQIKEYKAKHNID